MNSVRTYARLRYRVMQVHPARLLVFGYLLYMTVGWLALCLPVSQANPVSAVDNLFIAVSAVSTTGLVTIDPASSYTGFGEGVVLALIQLGGLGYLTVSSFIVLSALNSRNRLFVKVASASFSVPGGFDLPAFLRHVLVYTLASELVGAAALAVLFSANGVESPLWSAVFHSVSAFCTAGFSLNSNSFEGFPAMRQSRSCSAS